MSDLEKIIKSGFEVDIKLLPHMKLGEAMVIRALKIADGKKHFVAAYIPNEGQFSNIIEGFAVSLKRKGLIDV